MSSLSRSKQITYIPTARLWNSLPSSAQMNLIPAARLQGSLTNWTEINIIPQHSRRVAWHVKKWNRYGAVYPVLNNSFWQLTRTACQVVLNKLHILLQHACGAACQVLSKSDLFPWDKCGRVWQDIDKSNLFNVEQLAKSHISAAWLQSSLPSSRIKLIPQRMSVQQPDKL